MSTHTGFHASNAREQARQVDGRFGEQTFTPAVGVDLGEGASELPEDPAEAAYEAAVERHRAALRVLEYASIELNDTALHRCGAKVRRLCPDAEYLSVEFAHDSDFSSPTPEFQLHGADGKPIDTSGHDDLEETMSDLLARTDHAGLFNADYTQESLNPGGEELDPLGFSSHDQRAVWPISGLAENPRGAAGGAEWLKQSAAASRQAYEATQREANSGALRALATNARGRFPEATHVALMHDPDTISGHYITAVDADGSDLYQAVRGPEEIALTSPWGDYGVDADILAGQRELYADDLDTDLESDCVRGYWSIDTLNE